jgi:hypothetical protein
MMPIAIQNRLKHGVDQYDCARLRSAHRLRLRRQAMIRQPVQP